MRASLPLGGGNIRSGVTNLRRSQTCLVDGAASAVLRELGRWTLTAGLAAALCSACDRGAQSDQAPYAVPGVPTRAISLPTANVGTGMPLQCVPDPATSKCIATVELAFDRLLLPVSVTRQSIFLSDKQNPPHLATPLVAYDPVARVVRVTPRQEDAFTVGSTYQVQIASPHDSSDPNGLRAIDGATFDTTKPAPVFEFAVAAAAMAPPGPPVIDFCKQAGDTLSRTCGNMLGCHHEAFSPTSPLQPALGLVLSLRTLQTTRVTTIGRVAEEANTGAFSHGQPVSRIFGQDMPIVDPGDPGNSWLVYKLLMAVNPAPGLTMTANAHSVQWMPLSDNERGVLSSLIPGREMPFPQDPKAVGTSLSLEQLEAISLWIAQGASVPDACQ